MPNVITGILLSRREKRREVRAGDVMKEAEGTTMRLLVLKMEEGHVPRNASSSKARRVKEMDSLLEPPGRMKPRF